MTNQEKLELIAQAREKLLREIKFENDKIVYNSQNKQPFILAMATTHLAEMDEHKNAFVEENYNIFESVEGWYCQGCYERNDSDTPCQKLVTKAKRLLGVE